MDLFQTRTRNELLHVLFHLSYDEIKILFLLNRSYFQFMKQFVKENYLLLKPIINKRFFDRAQTKIHKIEDYSFRWTADSNLSNYTDHIKNWKNKIPDIDWGDIIWLHRINKFIVMQDKKQIFCVNEVFVPNLQQFQFPKFYWKPIEEMCSHRLWIKVWM